MSTDTRDSLTLYIIAAAAVLVTLFVDVEGFWRPFAAMMAAFGAAGVLRPHLAGAWSILPDVPATLLAVEQALAPEAPIEGRLA